MEEIEDLDDATLRMWDILNYLREKGPQSRKMALAKTHLETAILWAESFAGEGDNDG